MGGDAARRAATARLRGVVSDADAADSCPRAASGVHRVRARHQTRKRGHQHPPGEETQFDWVEINPEPPAHWGFRKTAYVLVGSLAHSGVWRGVISPSMDTPHLLAAMTTLLALLGGLTKTWRFDRMRTVLDHRTGDLVPQFAAFAKHHGVTAVVCRPRSGSKAWSRRTEITPPRNALVADLARRPHPRASAGQPEHVRRRAGRPAA